jgi:hypothetical protein
VPLSLSAELDRRIAFRAHPVSYRQEGVTEASRDEAVSVLLTNALNLANLDF